MADVWRNVRHATTPEPNACRWCGIPRYGHGQRWVPSKRWHSWEMPTPAQRYARIFVREEENTLPSFVGMLRLNDPHLSERAKSIVRGEEAG